jgi:hypothetical protein
MTDEPTLGLHERQRGKQVAPATSRRLLGYPERAFTSRGRGGRSATALDTGGYAWPSEPASGLS